MSVNKVILVGNVGKDPEVRYLEGGTAVCSFSMATSETYRNRDGERVSNTEWHNIVLWRGLAEVAEKYIKKGSQLYIEGRIRTRSWEDRDGNKRYTTEVIGDNMQMLGRRSDDQQQDGGSARVQSGGSDVVSDSGSSGGQDSGSSGGQDSDSSGGQGSGSSGGQGSDSSGGQGSDSSGGQGSDSSGGQDSGSSGGQDSGSSGKDSDSSGGQGSDSSGKDSGSQPSGGTGTDPNFNDIDSNAVSDDLPF